MAGLEVGIAIPALLDACVKVVKGVQDIRGKFKTAPLIMLSVAAECSSLHTVLSELEDLQLRLQSISDEERQKRFLGSLRVLSSSCGLVLSALEENLNRILEARWDIEDAETAVKSQTTWQKTKFIFNEGEFKELLNLLRGYESSLSMTLNTLQK